MQVDARMGPVPQGRQASSAYLLSWVAVAAFGLGYIAVAATRPDLLGAILPLAEPQQEQAVAGRTAADISDELATLRKWVHDLQHELAAARNTIQDQAAQNVAIVQRLTTAEERIAAVKEDQAAQNVAIVQRLTTAEERIAAVKEIRASEPPPAGRPATAVQRLQRGAQAPAATAPAVSSSAPKQQEQAPVIAAPLSVDQPGQGAGNVRVLNSTSQIATGSVPDASAATAAAAAQAKPAPPPSPRAVEIGSFDSLDGLRSRWSDISGRNSEVLGSMAPRYRLAADGRATPFTLLAGPFETTADATKACTALRAKGVPCRVGAFGGNSF